MSKMVVNGSGVNEAELRRMLKTFNEGPVARDPEFLRVFAVTLKSQVTQQLSQPGKGKPKRVRKVQYSYTGTKRAKLGPVLPGAKPLAAVGEIKKRRRSGKQYFHAPSLPGDPPAPDTAALKRSVYVEKSGPANYVVGVAQKYAEPLEFGTSRIAARPFFRPAIKRALEIFGIKDD